MSPQVGIPLNPPHTKKPKKWYEKPFGIVLLMVIAGLIVAWCVYYFGWN